MIVPESECYQRHNRQRWAVAVALCLMVCTSIATFYFLGLFSAHRVVKYNVDGYECISVWSQTKEDHWKFCHGYLRDKRNVQESTGYSNQVFPWFYHEEVETMSRGRKQRLYLTRSSICVNGRWLDISDDAKMFVVLDDGQVRPCLLHHAISVSSSPIDSLAQVSQSVEWWRDVVPIIDPDRVGAFQSPN